MSAMRPVRMASWTRSKYRAVPTEVDGHRFASQAEARRFGELKLLEKAGEIRRLELQPAFPLAVLGVTLGEFVADFQYEQRGDEGIWKFVVEDVKGMRTLPLAKWKQKHLWAQYGIQVVEVR
jgi:hypothetical protein